MARNEQDREDLIAEATALVDRIEFLMPEPRDEDEELLFAGFRKNGFLSIYCGSDLHYQFDHHGCLRRAYVHPYLFRAAYGNLSRIERKRAGDQTILERLDLDEQQSHQFVTTYRRQLNGLQTLLLSENLEVSRYVLSDEQATSEDLLGRLNTSLETILSKSDDFFSRTIKGKRLK